MQGVRLEKLSGPAVHAGVMTAFLVVLIACQTREREAPRAGSGAGSGSAYARDLDRICRVKEYATRDQPGADTLYATANWLGAHLETPAARDLLARFSRAGDRDKGPLLRAELTRVGAPADCPTAAEWESLP